MFHGYDPSTYRTRWTLSHTCVAHDSANSLARRTDHGDYSPVTHALVCGLPLSLILSSRHYVQGECCEDRRHVTNPCIMASSLLYRAWKPLRRLAWKPLVFPKEGTVSIPVSEQVEEEAIPGYLATRYYPVRVGQTFQNRYQVVGKLRFGITSTVWLARDLEWVFSIALNADLGLTRLYQRVSTCCSQTLHTIRFHLK